MYTRKHVIGIIAVFVFVYLFDWLFHSSTYLKDLYMETMTLWRPEADMPAFMWWLIGGEFVYAFMFCAMFIWFGGETRGIKGGITYGVLLTLLLMGGLLVTYAVQPMPLILPIYWVIGDLVKNIIAGVILVLVLRPKV